MTDFLAITQRVERAKEVWEHLNCIYIELLDGIHLVWVAFALATAKHVHVQLVDITTCACNQCSSVILQLPVSLLLEIAGCKITSVTAV